MKIGVISDTHIPDRAKEIPRKVLDGLKDADLILHAGDLIDLKVLDVLKNICKDIRAVWGNMDSVEVRRSLAEKEIISIEDLHIGLTHGYGHPLKLIEVVSDIFKHNKVDIIVFGHAHYPINEKKQGILYFNPGSPTDKIFSTLNSYGILEIVDNQIKADIIRV